MSTDPMAEYYDAGGIETIEIIRAKLTPEQFRGYLLGNLLKYACRMNFKGCPGRDAEKAGQYAGWLTRLAHSDTAEDEAMKNDPITDTDRLDFLLEYFRVDDVGVEKYCPGVVIQNEPLEDILTWGQGENPRENQCDTENLRDIIDRALLSPFRGIRRQM